MKVLITGGTGYIGGAVLDALVAAGHEVAVVVRDAGKADAVRARGGEPVDGDLRDASRLAALARGADAVIHTANTNGPDAPDVDTAATRAFISALSGTQKPFVYTSGVWILGATGEHAADERASRNPPALVAWRASLEPEILAAEGLRGVIVRPGIVFGEGGGIPGMLASGALPLVGGGAQRMPLVHVRDLADLYVRALGAPRGTILHGVASTATARAVIGALAPDFTPTVLPLDVARERMGAFADALALDQLVSADATRAIVGWAPRHGL